MSLRVGQWIEEIRDMFLVYLHRREFHFSLSHINKIHKRCVIISDGGVPGIAN